MAETTKLILEIETLLRGMDKTLRGLDAIKKKLESVANIKVGGKSVSAGTDRATIAAQKLAQQQQKLLIQTQELTNRQERARQTADRLALAQQRLTRSQQQFASATQTASRNAITLDQTLGRVGGSLRNLGLGLTSLGSSLSIALTAPLTALGLLATRNAVQLDSLKRGLTAITGSASEASRELQRLTQIAKLPGIGFQEAIQGSIRLQAVGFSAEQAEKALVQFSNAVALTGGGREELARITVQLGQLSAKGKVLAQDLKPIIEAAPAVGVALRQAFGTVNSEDIQALGISTEEFLSILIKQLGQLPRAAAGVRNTFDNFADAVFRASAAIGEAIIPVLTRLIEVAEPVITRLAEGFKALPAPLQTLVVTFGALTAAVGPALFILGQFSTGVGGLISALGRLHALGLLPNIAALGTLTQVLRASTAAMIAQAQAATVAQLAFAGLGAAAVAVVAISAAIILLSRRQRDAVKISQEQIETTNKQIESLEDQLKFTNGLQKGVERTADEQERLSEIYASLNTQAKIRLTNISDEEKRLVGLREELQRLLALRNEERIQQAANLAASLADTTAQIEAAQRSRDSVADRVRANTQLAQTIQRQGKITAENAKILAEQGITAASVESAIFNLNKANERLIDRQTELIDSSKKLNGTAQEQGEALRTLQQQTGLSARELLTAAKAMGVFKGDVEATLPSLEKFIETEKEAISVTDQLNRALRKGGDDLIKAGEKGEAAEKRRKSLIEAAATIARETSVSFQGAVKSMKQEVEAVGELREALKRESELTGKSIDQLITDALTKGLDKGGSQLRNAREQLANAILEVGQAQAEQEAARQKAHNDAMLEGNENSYRRQLQAYRQYLEARALFTTANLDEEIAAEQARAKNARLAQVRLLAASRGARVPEAERVRRQAQAAQQEEKAIQAETKIIELEAQRQKVTFDLQQALAEANIEQVKDVRQLQIEYATLTGRIEDALNAATDEKFRESLKQLALAQDFLNKKIVEAQRNKQPEREAELRAERELNQTQIEAIHNIVTQERATNQLAAAQEFVRRAKERQAELERDLAFQVEFRGLKEEDAIRQRLEGEQRLADRLRIVRDLIQATVNGLTERGLKPPQSLIEFIRDLKGELKGLAGLPFSEQFRLVEKEFNRINDERLQKIADIERAVRERDIAEAEGLLFIRRINGQYSADLEEQLRLLKQIAAASGDANLAKQAQSAEETVKDANSELASMNRQLRATSIDALGDTFTDFFRSVGDRSRTMKEKLLDAVDSFVQRVNDVIAENLSRKLIESIFGGGENAGGGILNALGRLFGLGGAKESAKAGVADVAGKAAETAGISAALQTGATAAGVTLQTAAAAAATTQAASSVTFATAVTTAATTFATIVTAAASAIAAALTTSQTAASIGSGIGNFAQGDLIPPRVGGRLAVVAEGGYPEAVLTTDPRFAARQLQILKTYLHQTRGLYGRIKGFAEGGIISPQQAEMNLLSNFQVPVSVNANLADLPVASAGGGTMRFRHVLVDKRSAADWINTPEGERAVIDVLEKNRPTVRKLSS